MAIILTSTATIEHRFLTLRKLKTSLKSTISESKKVANSGKEKYSNIISIVSLQFLCILFNYKLCKNSQDYYNFKTNSLYLFLIS